MSEVTDKIRSRAHWDVTIAPATFDEGRVNYESLEEVLEPLVVSFRGWPVPYIQRGDLLRGADWVGQDVDAENVAHYEAWRFFTSGQFSQLRAVSVDWRAPDPSTPQTFQVIEVWEILFYLTEVFELATRLSLSPAGDESMTVGASLNGLGERRLVLGLPRRMPLDRNYGPSPPTLSNEVTLSREELAADPRGAAVEMARDFFLRFGWKPSRDQLRDVQGDLVS